MSIRFATINSTAPTLRTTPGTTIRRIGVRYPIATATWPSGLAIRAKRARERLFEIRRMPAGATSPRKAGGPNAGDRKAGGKSAEGKAGSKAKGGASKQATGKAGGSKKAASSKQAGSKQAGSKQAGSKQAGSKQAARSK